MNVLEMCFNIKKVMNLLLKKAINQKGSGVVGLTSVTILLVICR